MYKRKHPRSNLSIGITAMCNVALLILFFFIVTAQPRSWEPIDIEPPYASSNLIDHFVGYGAEILIGHGKVFFELPKNLREQTLILIGNKYHINFSAAEISKFETIDIIGVPIPELKQYIDGYYNEESYLNQKGIRIDSAENELANWLGESRKAYKSLSDKKLRVYVKADKREAFPIIRKIFDIMQIQGISKFSLITFLKSTDR